MKLSIPSNGPMPSPIGRHAFRRLNSSDFAGVALLIALVLVALYGFSDSVVSNDEGLPQHYGAHLFRIRYGADALKQ